MTNKLVYTLVLIAFLLGLIAGSANYYNGLNTGVSWNRGGVDLYPTPAVYLCDANYNMRTQTSTHYNWYEWLNFLVVNC